MTARKLSQDDYRLLAEFRYLLRRFLAFSEEAARESGLAPQQHQALLAIKGFAGPKAPAVGDLAARLGIRHNSAVELVNRLEKAKLIARKNDSTDARRVAIALTAGGERALAKLTGAHREELARLAPELKQLLAKMTKTNH
ncbi:MAG TPA: helix-turn-helix domain-containing protein [Rhizomicrobium sp.]|nr:helix-turn-helix domain-containing protein [Rhizomicrobium sp.]